jgi:hypothetical protein
LERHDAIVDPPDRCAALQARRYTTLSSIR